MDRNVLQDREERGLIALLEDTADTDETTLVSVPFSQPFT